MKKTIIILLFAAIALTSLQIACSKSEAQTTPAVTSTTQLNKVIFAKKFSNAYPEIWVCNYDGTNATRVNITLPSGIVFSDKLQSSLSPNGQKIFFTAGPSEFSSDRTTYNTDLYVCNIDGTGVTKIYDRGTSAIQLGGAY
jgi:Tol biopolymer transport system component